MAHSIVARMVIASIVVSGATVVSAQTASTGSGHGYPSKPIRMLAPVGGGPTDLASRLISDAVAGSLGQRMVIENRGIIGVEIAAQAPPDGYTLLHYTNTLWLMPLFRSASWDPVRDFAPVSLTMRTPNVVVVHPSLPAKSIKELIALAKARPGELNYASSSTGSSNHVGAELFKAMAGVNLVRINYKGGGTAVIDLMAGQVQIMFGSAGLVTQHVKAGKLRALAVTTAQPSVLAPGLPTVAAAGLPGYESNQLTGVFAPAKTPPAIITRLNTEIAQALRRPEVKERLFNGGVEAIGSTVEEFAATIRAEMTTMSKIIKDAGLRE